MDPELENQIKLFQTSLLELFGKRKTQKNLDEEGNEIDWKDNFWKNDLESEGSDGKESKISEFFQEIIKSLKDFDKDNDSQTDEDNYKL